MRIVYLNPQTETMKKQIIAKLKKIQRVANETGMSGKLSISYSGVSVEEWDAIVDSITEFPRYNHFIEVTPRLQISLILD